MRLGILRKAARVLAALCVVGAFGAMAGPAAGQEAGEDEEVMLPDSYLDAYAWWSKAQQSPIGGNQVPNTSCPDRPDETPPEVPEVNECPAGPPEDGIYVVYDYETLGQQNDVNGATGNPTGPLNNLPSTPTTQPPPDDRIPTAYPPEALGPMAFGAVRYYVPEGAESVLTLQILSRNTTQPGGVDPMSLMKVFACAAEPGWAAIQNGRYDQAPAYDCSTADEALLEGDTATFDLSPAFVLNGMIDVVIIGQGDKPFSIAFGPPQDSSLFVTNAEELAGEEELLLEEDFSLEDPLTEFLEEVAIDEAGDLAALDAAGSEFAIGGGDDFGSIVTSGPVSRPTTTKVVPTSKFRNPFGPDAGYRERLMAVAILMAMGAALWWFGGQPTRGPRLLGSLGDGRTAEAPVGERGIGRFSKPRTGRPRRLL